MLERFPRRLTAATVALACFGGGLAVAAGAHQYRVRSVIAEARETAQMVEASRASLETSYSRALTASSDASDVAADDQVATAASELQTVADEASKTAESLNVDVDAPDVASAIEAASESEDDAAAEEAADADRESTGEAAETEAAETEATAEDESATASSPSASPSPDSPDLSADAEAAAAAVDDPAVQDVLDGEVTDIETVEATIEKLEQAAATLELQARLVEGSAAELEQAAAVATLTQENTDLDTQIEGVNEAIKANRALRETLEGLVTDDTTLEDLDTERKALKGLVDQAEDLDRDDIDAVSDYRADLEDQGATMLAAEEAAVESHQAWVAKENARRDKENDKRTAAYKKAVAAARAKLPAAYREAVANNQSGWSGAPTGVTYANGYIPSSQLCTLDFAPSYQLQCAAAEALESANAAYRQETGSNLEVISAYRSYSAQVATSASRGAYAAAPGTSNHGWGMAIDLGTGSAAWLRENGASYGWVHPLWARSGGSKPEAWHLEFVAPNAAASVQMPSEPDLLTHVETVVGD